MQPHAATPEALGISSDALNSYLDAVARTPGQELHGLVVMRHGRIACDLSFRPYDTITPHVLYSLSKSFTSVAAGFAEAEGLFRRSDRVADLLPEKMPKKPSERLLRITVNDLLCMGAGLDPKSDWPGPGVRDWTKNAFSLPIVHEPGTVFHYNSVSTYIVSDIVQRVCGQPIRDYLNPRLFAPLGISSPVWEKSPMGVCCGGWGLHLSTHDIAKFGQLLLNDGIWEGIRVLPEGWVASATSMKIDNSTGWHPEWQQGYGQQFWRCRDNRFRGDGMYGQFCWVLPDKDAVVAVTAGIIDMGTEADLLRDFLFPAFDAAPSGEDGQARFRARAAALRYPFPETGRGSVEPFTGFFRAEDGSEIGIKLEKNALCVRFSPKKGTATTLRYGRGEPLVSAGKENKRDALAGLTKFAAYGVEGGVLRLMLRICGAPHTQIGELTLSGNALSVEMDGAGFKQDKKVYQRV